MEEFVKGEIVVIDFPFSSGETKKRPALVLVNLKGEDIILCQITSTIKESSIEIKKSDFEKGQLNQTSYVRIQKIFTLEKKNIKYKIGKLTKNKIFEIEKELIKLFTI